MKQTTLHIRLMACAIALPILASQSTASAADDAAAAYVSATQLATELRASIASHNDPALATVGVTPQYAIHEVHREKAGPPAAHDDSTELHYILEGRAIFVTGGKIEKHGSEQVIAGGTERAVQAGDAVIVPAGSPHWYRQIDAPLSYLEVRFVTRAATVPQH
jgi:mannose-6-phosphate isomerase-like protein (cupin superfamily)